MTELVTVAFYRGGDDGCNEPLINQATMFLTGKFCHCELIFDDLRTGVHNLACGIWADQVVYLREKTFGRQNWSYKDITLGQKSVRTMRAWCLQQVGKPFNKWGFWRALTPFPRRTDSTCWFCSEMVVTAFQAAGCFEGTLASTVTPTEVWAMCESSLNSHQGASPLFAARLGASPMRFTPRKKSALRMIRQWQPPV